MNENNSTQQSQTVDEPTSITDHEENTTLHDDEHCAHAKEYIELAKRARADYENLKKETEKWRAEFVQFAHVSLIEEMLTIIDNFNEALVHIPEDQKNVPWVIGIAHIKKQLDSFLDKNGVVSFGAHGEMFNPQLHEAAEEVADAGRKPQEIVKVLRSGFKYNDMIIRPARVIVAK